MVQANKTSFQDFISSRSAGPGRSRVALEKMQCMPFFNKHVNPDSKEKTTRRTKVVIWTYLIKIQQVLIALIFNVLNILMRIESLKNQALILTKNGNIWIPFITIQGLYNIFSVMLLQLRLRFLQIKIKMHIWLPNKS